MPKPKRKTRSLRWTVGGVVTYRLRARKFAVMQMLEFPSIAILQRLVTTPGSARAVSRALSGEVYRVLSVYRSVLSACEATGIRTAPVASKPSYFIRDLNGIYTLWNPDGTWRRGVRPERCRGLEKMAVWNDASLRSRLEAHFLGDGYDPELG